MTRASGRLATRLRRQRAAQRSGDGTRWFVAGMVQGATELLPVSSSAHTALARRLLRLTNRRVPEQRSGRAAEVAAHAGSLLALLVCGRLRRPRDTTAVLLTLGPPVVAATLFRHWLTQAARDGRTTACAQACSALLLLAAAQRSPRAGAGSTRRRRRYEALSGLAQTLALIPGVSRSGAITAAVMLAGGDRRLASELVDETTGPVLAAAVVREALTVALSPVRRELATPLAACALGAGTATALSAQFLPRELEHPALRRLAIYRLLLAALQGRLAMPRGGP